MRVQVKDGATPYLLKLKKALEPANIDRVVERVALQTLAEVVKATPKRWFGQVRAGWEVLKPQAGMRLVINQHKVMLFLEEGTANQGTGYIYPKTKKALYIPLNRKAALGWNTGLVMQRVKKGVLIPGDYILRPRVKGMRPRWIARTQAVRTKALLLEAMKQHVRQAIAA